MLDLKLKNMILSLSLGLILNSSLAWPMNQAKPSPVKFKLLYFITSSSLNFICRLISSSSQVWTFYFCCQVELEHSLLDKAWLVYSPKPSQSIGEVNKWFMKVLYCSDYVTEVIQLCSFAIGGKKLIKHRNKHKKQTS